MIRNIRRKRKTNLETNKQKNATRNKGRENYIERWSNKERGVKKERQRQIHKLMFTDAYK